MCVIIRKVFERKVIYTKATVAPIVEPNSERVPTRHDDPLSYIKLAVFNQ